MIGDIVRFINESSNAHVEFYVKTTNVDDIDCRYDSDVEEVVRRKGTGVVDDGEFETNLEYIVE
jgi:hypothetical protein